MMQFLSGTLFIIGAVVGGGILAIPIASAHFGFLSTLAFIILAWFIMTKTGLYILELSLNCPKQFNSYYTIAEKTLGHRVKLFTMMLFLCLLYFSLASCLSGCTSILLGYLPNALHPFYCSVSVFFVLGFAILTIFSRKLYFRINLLVILLKIGLLFSVLVFSIGHFTFIDANSHIFKSGIVSFLLLIINSFGFHFIIPSLVTHYGKQQADLLRKILITSTTIVMVIYIAWLYIIYSVIPLEGEYGLLSIYNSKNQLFLFNTSLLYHIQNERLVGLVSSFESIALFGSFFCISLAVFDFFVDALKTSNRPVLVLLTYFPPLMLSFFSANMYIYAMTAAGYIAFILEIIIPIWARRRSVKSSSNCFYDLYFMQHHG